MTVEPKAQAMERAAVLVKQAQAESGQSDMTIGAGLAYLAEGGGMRKLEGSWTRLQTPWPKRYIPKFSKQSNGIRNGAPQKRKGTGGATKVAKTTR